MRTAGQGRDKGLKRRAGAGGRAGVLTGIAEAEAETDGFGE